MTRRLEAGLLTAAKIVGETADVDRFANTDAFARYNGTAPFARLVLQRAPSQTVTHWQSATEHRDPPDRANPGPSPPARKGAHQTPS